jgi:16S rRNA (guanine527-N7)-methyltransferase
VEAVAQALQLKNVTIQHIRAEEIRNRKFDFAVSRAVAPLKDLWKWSKPLLKAPGYKKKVKDKDEATEPVHKPGLLCLKGGDLAQEIHDSGTRPKSIEINSLFKEDYFKEKYLLYVS